MTLPLMDIRRLVQGVVIKGKTNGQAGGPSIIEHWIMVQKKSLWKFSDNGLTLYQSSGILTNQKMDMVVGVPSSHSNYSLYAPDCVLHNIPPLDEINLVGSKTGMEV